MAFDLVFGLLPNILSTKCTVQKSICLNSKCSHLFLWLATIKGSKYVIACNPFWVLTICFAYLYNVSLYNNHHNCTILDIRQWPFHSLYTYSMSLRLHSMALVNCFSSALVLLNCTRKSNNKNSLRFRELCNSYSRHLTRWTFFLFRFIIILSVVQ